MTAAGTADVERYAAYLELPAGRLRRDLAFANLQEFLPPADRASAAESDAGSGCAAALERTLGAMPEFAAIARYAQVLARRAP